MRKGEGALYYKTANLKFEVQFINDEYKDDFDENENDINFLKK